MILTAEVKQNREFVISRQIYTMGHKKRATLFWTISTMFLGGFFTLLVPTETGMNTLQITYLSFS